MRRKAASGSHVIYLIGLILISLMVSALAIDFGYLFTTRNQLQTDADAAALGATDELYRNIGVDVATKLREAKRAAQDLVTQNQADMTLSGQDVIFGFIDPVTKLYNPTTFSHGSTDPSYALTGGYNAVYVRVRKHEDSANQPVNTIMANMLGIRHMNTEAESIALIDQTITSITSGGVRPIYACQTQFNRTMQDGIPDNNVVRIYGDHVEVDGVQNQTGCPPMGSGNWGFADFRNCSANAVGSSTIADWFASGYPGTVNIGQCYSTNPGNFINSIGNELDWLITNKTIFPIPLYNTWSGSGSNSRVNVSGFVGFQITSYKATGTQSSRYIEGHFKRFVCKSGCNSGSSTSGSTPGGTLVKIRLAARS